MPSLTSQRGERETDRERDRERERERERERSKEEIRIFQIFMLSSKSCPLASLPVHIRSKVSLECPEQDYIHLNGMSDTIR